LATLLVARGQRHADRQGEGAQGTPAGERRMVRHRAASFAAMASASRDPVRATPTEILGLWSADIGGTGLGALVAGMQSSGIDIKIFRILL